MSTSCDSITMPLMPLDVALEQMLSSVSAINRSEDIPLDEAYGRVLSQSVHSPINVPLCDNSAMDGYAFHADDLARTDCPLPIVFTQYAGDPQRTLLPGQAARIFTGAALPFNTAAVEIQERCKLVSQAQGKAEASSGSEYEADSSSNTNAVIFATALTHGQNIRLAGEDLRADQLLFDSGHQLSIADIAVLASSGISSVPCAEPLRVAFMYTGDELIEPGQAIAAGQVYNSNKYSLIGLLKRLNCECIDIGAVKDTLDDSKHALSTAAQGADLIISTGGVSVGEADFMRHAANELGKLNLWRLKLKPGKPVAFGHINDTPYIALPGNPVSSYVTFYLIAQQVIRKLQGKTNTASTRYQLPLQDDWTSEVPREEYIRVRKVIEDGVECLQAYPQQGSAVISSLSWCTGLAKLPVGSQLKKGELVDYLPLLDLD